jgi:hypothetical protein
LKSSITTEIRRGGTDLRQKATGLFPVALIDLLDLGHHGILSAGNRQFQTVRFHVNEEARPVRKLNSNFLWSVTPNLFNKKGKKGTSKKGTQKRKKEKGDESKKGTLVQMQLKYTL